ncbi:MAG: hypothetical protein IKU46_00755 [Peptococcaceae bacterium]|nr:hypothetical protein [Peptococcaceae bacterium]
MSDVIEEYKNKCVREEQMITASNLLKAGVPLEVIKQAIPAISNDTLLQLKEYASV